MSITNVNGGKGKMERGSITSSLILDNFLGKTKLHLLSFDILLHVLLRQVPFL
jgi:hypothetical protein